jgi:hypothetical protein
MPKRSIYRVNAEEEEQTQKKKKKKRKNMIYNKKTAHCFFEWKYHTSGFLGRETHETAGGVDFPVPFSVYQMTLNESILRHF